jgi:hypothetical protein
LDSTQLPAWQQRLQVAQAQAKESHPLPCRLWCDFDGGDPSLRSMELREVQIVATHFLQIV